MGAARAGGRARERSSSRARQGVSRGRRGHHGRSRRSGGRRVPPRRDGPWAAGGHLRVLARPLLRAEGGGPRDPRRSDAARESGGVGQGNIGRGSGEGADPRRGRGQPGGTAAGDVAARADGGDPQGARRGRHRRRPRGVPDQDRRRRDAGGRAHAGRAGARPARAHVGAVAGIRLDPHVPRLVARRSVVGQERGQPRHRRSPDRAGRRSRGSPRREGSDPRVPRGPEAAR